MLTESTRFYVLWWVAGRACGTRTPHESGPVVYRKIVLVNLQGVKQGLTSEQIADQLCLSYFTVHIALRTGNVRQQKSTYTVV